MKLSAEDKKLVARMKEIRELIKEFGLALHGYDPGVSAYRDDESRPGSYNTLRFDGQEWAWLEPLLVELRMHRRLNGTNSARLMKWLKNPSRKSAELAFTDGPDRQTASWMEIAMRQAKKEMGGMF